MRSKLIFILFLLLPLANLAGQNQLINIGYNANPVKLLEGHYELVGLINWTKRFKSKIAAGGTYTKSGTLLYWRTRCLVDDNVDDRIEKGLFGKFSLDFSFFKFEKFDIYLGAGMFYTSLTTQGVYTPSKSELNNAGDIFGLGMTLGTRIKNIDPFIIDLGIEGYYYDGDHYQVGNPCRGTIPGIGEAGGEKLLLTVYAHVFF